MRSMSHDEILHKYIVPKTSESTVDADSKSQYAKAPMPYATMSSQSYDVETRAVDMVRHQWIHDMASSDGNLLQD